MEINSKNYICVKCGYIKKTFEAVPYYDKCPLCHNRLKPYNPPDINKIYQEKLREIIEAIYQLNKEEVWNKIETTKRGYKDRIFYRMLFFTALKKLGLKWREK